MEKKPDLICPFTPFISNSQRSYTCVRELCKLWDKKRKDCGLKR